MLGFIWGQPTPIIRPVNKTYKWFVKCNLRVLRIFMGLGLELIFGSYHETEKYYSISVPSISTFLGCFCQIVIL